MEKSYIDLKNTFKTLRSIDAGKINQVLIESTENNEDTGDAVPYTKNDEMMSSILESAKTQFGASFEGFKNPACIRERGRRLGAAFFGLPGIRGGILLRR